jgi:plasmid maintenance system antidote protein VapI
MGKRKKKLTATDVLREAIRDSGLSNYRIAMDTGLTQSSVGRFINGETSIVLDAADRLFDYFDLELKRRRK